MNGKQVVVTFNVSDEGYIDNLKCSGDKDVCDSATTTLTLIGMLPRPPINCKDCKNVIIKMTPQI